MYSRTLVNGWLWNTRATNNVTRCSRLVPVIMEFVLIHGNSPCIILFNVIQKLMHVDSWSSACLRREVWHTWNLRIPTGCTDTNRWRCYNCCCGKRAVENLMWYRTVIGTGPTEGPQSTSWPSVGSTTLLAERARVSRHSFSSSILLITTRRPWFDHLIPCALRQWRKLNVSGHKLYNIFVFFTTGLTLRRACAIFLPLYKPDRGCGRYKFKPSTDTGTRISRFIHRICYPLRDRIVKLETEWLAC